ncbi:hypothetical protein AO263_26465 [Pseudomonas sp. NZIPFR-PS5]|nr:hypothetical protein AO263_26465 [Pseudomonas sp. NZIPFR-PS5]
MLRPVGTDDLKIHQWSTGSRGYGAPFSSAFKHGIHTIDNHRAAQIKVAGRQPVGNQIPRAAHIPRKIRRITKGLFNRIDAHINGTQRCGQTLGDGRLTGTGQTTEDDEHLRLPIGWLFKQANLLL